LVAADIAGDPGSLDGGLRIDAAPGPEGATIAFRGDLDLAGVGAAEAAIRDAMAAPGDVTIDLGGLEFMGSEGIRMILRARERAEAEGRALRVVAEGGAARRLIDILGLAERLDLDRDAR
jgi:anti-anti-sigma factor